MYSDFSEYYKEGTVRLRFKQTERFNLFRAVLQEIYSEKLKDEFSLVEKYKNTLDLRPTAFDYDESLLDLLFENDIPEILSEIVSSDMTLSHIQIRKSYPGPSYMPFHRDTYFSGEKVIGMTPPAHKLIYYPKFDNMIDEEKLSLFPGTHNCLFKYQSESHFLLPGFSVYDQQLLNVFNRESYSPSIDEFIIFNTAQIHGAENENDPNGSIRIIYSFIKNSQFENTFSSKEDHARLNNLYREKLNE